MKKWFSTWLVAIRPFSFPASTMPVIFGSVLAVAFGQAHFNLGLCLLALAGMVLLHAGANILSDVNDFRRGLDKVPTPVSGAIVRGMITLQQGRRASALLFAIGGLIGLIIAAAVGPAILIIGTIGILIGALYTASPIALKYHRLGDLAVFFDFGILGALGAWIVQTGSFAWQPVIWSIPLSLLVVAILHANNWRDIGSDKDGDIATVAALLGQRGSRIYYGTLIFGAFAVIPLLIILSNEFKLGPTMPWQFMIVLLALPKAIGLWRKGSSAHVRARSMEFITLDGATAQLNLMFGLLCVAAALVQVLMGRAG